MRIAIWALWIQDRNESFWLDDISLYTKEMKYQMRPMWHF